MNFFTSSCYRCGSALILLLLTLTTGGQVRAQASSQVPFGVYLEAECAAIGDNWMIGTDTLASRDSFVVVKSGFESLDTPPADEMENMVTFTLNVQAMDDLHLWARVNAASDREDSFWVRINGGEWIKWFNRLREGDEGLWIWRAVTGSPFIVEAGVMTVDFAFRERSTRLDKIYVSSLRASPTNTGKGGPAINCGITSDCDLDPASCAGESWIEAECGMLGSRWNYTVNPLASNSGYVTATGPSALTAPTTTGADDQITYTTTVDEAGDYYLYFLMNAPNAGKNSFWVKVDEGNWINFGNELDGTDLSTSGFEWRRVTQAADSTSLSLEAGEHTIYVANREFGTQLDKVFLGTTTTAPTGFGKFSTNCQPNATTPTQAPIDLTSEVFVYPNPVANTLHLSLDAAITGTVDVRIVDMTGRMITKMTYTKSATVMTDDINVSQLAKGVYRLVVTSQAGVLTRPFVKQ